MFNTTESHWTQIGWRFLICQWVSYKLHSSVLPSFFLPFFTYVLLSFLSSFQFIVLFLTITISETLSVTSKTCINLSNNTTNFYLDNKYFVTHYLLPSCLSFIFLDSKFISRGRIISPQKILLESENYGIKRTDTFFVLPTPYV